MLARVTGRAALQFANLHGFELRAMRPIAELNLVAYAFVHSATGAAYYHVDCDDSNNHFCIGFRTPAQNNKGTSHVLEHTTLCGSRRFPVRDPFFLMMRRSLSSFMNAMTGADYTLYPFSTVNAQDFRNLLTVYLDAVFRPLLRKEDFEQEGHRVECAGAGAADARSGEAVAADGHDANATPTAASASAGSSTTGEGASAGVLADNEATTTSATVSTPSRPRLVYNGVVYNEMRGVVSDPSHHFARALLRSVLPETHYTYESGGDPLTLLQLTYDELVQFHATHYHPSNSVTFTYGNQHPSAHMEALDAYFAPFTRAAPVSVPTLSPAQRLTAPQTVYLDGPLDAMGNASRQKRVAVAYATPASHDTLEDVIAYSVLDTLLAHGPSAPMYRALIESHMGSEYTPMHGYAYYLSSPVISYGVAGVDEGRAHVEAEVREAVTGALRRVCDDGFDARRVRAVVFQEELQQRHRAANYGLHVCTGLCAMALCRAQHDPLDFINWLPHLQKIAASDGAQLLRYVRDGMLDNPHSVVVSVAARADYLPRMQAQLHRVEDDLNMAASDEDVAAVARASTLWLQRVRAEQDASVLPSLTVADIPVKAFAEPQPRRHEHACDAHTSDGNKSNDGSSSSGGGGGDDGERCDSHTARDEAACTSGVHCPRAATASSTSHVSTGPTTSAAAAAVVPNVYTLAHPTNGLVYVHGLVPFALSLAAAMATSDCADSVPADLPLFCALLARTGAGALAYKEQSIEHELVCNRFAFAPTLGESYTHKHTAIAGVYCNFYTTVAQLDAALALLRVTLCEPHTRDDDADVHSRALSLAKTHCSHAITNLQAHGNRIAMSCAVGRLTRRGALHERWWGLAHAKHASQLLDALQSSNADVQHGTVRQLLSGYRDVAQSLVAGMSAATWWATCEEGQRDVVAGLLRNFVTSVATRNSGSDANATSSTRIALAPRVPRSTTGAAATASETNAHVTHVTEQLPIDTSFVAFARRNELCWADTQQAALRVASVLLANEYLHRRVREEGGAYGSSAHATMLDEVGGVTMSSYRDPQPGATATAFAQAASWLSDAHNVTQARVDEAKLRLMASIDAPYAADSYGSSYFLHDVTQELRQAMRDRMLAVTPADILAVAHYFAPSDDAVIATLMPVQDDKSVQRDS